MREELKKYSSIGNREGILLLCKKVLTGQIEDLSSIRESCAFIDGVELKFNCGILAFEEINLISVENNKCKSQGLIYTDKDESLFIDSLCRYCLKTLIEMDYINIDYFKYNEIINAFQVPRYAFKMDCSVYRNLLIIFGALVPDGLVFTLNNAFEKDISCTISHKRKVSQEHLMKELEQQRHIGEKGEEFVLAFERKRCGFSEAQKERIKQISIVDASAGYDILSLENDHSNIKRYIEVKTYVGAVHFYWSINEIENAKLRGESYYLYLVNYDKINEDNYVPVMIANPFRVIKNMAIWSMSPSSYSITSECSEDDIKSNLLNENHLN